MDIELIIISLIVGVLLLLTSIYILALYSHVDEKDWGASTFCKFLVVFFKHTIMLFTIISINAGCWYVFELGISTYASH